MNDLPEGWFDDADVVVYRELYAALAEDAVTAELGTWLGRSLCSVADIIAEKGIEVAAVDTYKGTQTDAERPFFDAAKTRDIRAEFEANIKQAGISHLVSIHAVTTLEAAAQFPDETFDFVFIDADHSYPAVKADIEAWLPKVKEGGILAGDDYTFGSVRQAVDEMLENVEQKASIWIHRI